MAVADDKKVMRRYKVYRAIAGAFALLPFAVLHALSSVIAPLIGGVLGYRRKVIRRNLETSFPEKSKKELRKIERQFYRHLCDTIVEAVKLLHISEKSVCKHIRVENYELVNRANREGHPVVIFLGHYGNWEWAMRISDYFDTQGVVTGHIYKPQRDVAFDMLMNDIRSRFATRGITQKAAYRHHLRLTANRIMYVTGFLADQRPNGENTHLMLGFLGHPTQVMTGAEMIGKKTDARFVYLDVERPKRGHYVLTFKEMHPSEQDGNADDGKYPFTHCYFRMLEATIRRRPELYLWSHRRWREIFNETK